MILPYSLLFLVLIAACQGQEYCKFDKDLCIWSNSHPCGFKHVIDTPLAGEMGYIKLSKDTCRKASITFTKVRFFVHAFEIQYYINGPGTVSLSVKAEYLVAGKIRIWSCEAQQGHKWNTAEVYIRESIFDRLVHIIIEAVVDGDATIAIGNIGHTTRNIGEHSCPGSPAAEQLDATKKLTNTLKTEKRSPRNVSVVEILRDTSTFDASKKTKIINSTSKKTEAVDATDFPGTNSEFQTNPSSLSPAEKTAILNQDTTTPETGEATIPYRYESDERSTIKQTSSEEPLLDVLNKTGELELPSSIVDGDDLVDSKFDSDSEFNWSIVTVCSLLALIVLISLFAFSVIVYKRRIEILNVYEVDGRSLTENLYE